jgi:hypothetical protein
MQINILILTAPETNGLKQKDCEASELSFSARVNGRSS